jgi:hypothetical protein
VLDIGAGVPLPGERQSGNTIGQRVRRDVIREDLIPVSVLSRMSAIAPVYRRRNRFAMAGSCSGVITMVIIDSPAAQWPLRMRGYHVDAGSAICI